jgi:hypothetical protein
MTRRKTPRSPAEHHTFQPGKGRFTNGEENGTTQGRSQIGPEQAWKGSAEAPDGIRAWARQRKFHAEEPRERQDQCGQGKTGQGDCGQGSNRPSKGCSGTPAKTRRGDHDSGGIHNHNACFARPG